MISFGFTWKVDLQGKGRSDAGWRLRLRGWFNLIPAATCYTVLGRASLDHITCIAPRWCSHLSTREKKLATKVLAMASPRRTHQPALYQWLGTETAGTNPSPPRKS